MSKWREERMYEIMNHLWDNPKLMELYELEMKKVGIFCSKWFLDF